MKKFYLFSFAMFMLASGTMIGQNNSLKFDGVDDHVDCGDFTLPNFTVEAWVYVIAGKRDQALVSMLTDTNAASNFELKLNASESAVLTVNNGVDVYNVQSDKILSASRWYHVAVTNNATDFNIYIDGVLDKTATLTTGNYASSTSRLVIGSRPSSAGIVSEVTTTCRLDEVRIWNTVRTQQEIVDNMGAGLTVLPATLGAYYKFDQGTAGDDNRMVTSLDDASPNAKNGVLNNFSLSGVWSNWVNGFSSSHLTVNALSSNNLGAAAGSFGLVIVSNTDWTLTSNSQWLTVSPMSGSGDGTVTVNFTANAPSNVVRDAIVTITAIGVEKKVIAFVQSPSVVINVGIGSNNISFNANNNTVVFTDETVVEGTALTSWLWDFGDGATSTEQNPTHVYANNGVYLVKLNVSDGTYTKSLTKNVVTSADITMATTTVSILDTRNFYDSGHANLEYANFESHSLVLVPATVGKYVQISFDAVNLEKDYDCLRIYDGMDVNAPLLATLTDIYTEKVNVIAANGTGALCVRFNTDEGITRSGWSATVSEVAVLVDFSVDKTLGAPGDVFAFTYVGTESATAWLWNFGDGSSSTDKNPTHQYGLNGTYSVSLIITYDGGKTENVTKTDYVRAGVILMKDGTCIVGEPSLFFDSGGEFLNYQTFEDYTYVFYPAGIGKAVQIDFGSVDVEQGFDSVLIYNGVDVTAPLLLNLSGVYSDVTVVATNSQGALCVLFESDRSQVLTGWAATVNQVPAMPTALQPTMPDTREITVYPAVFVDQLTIGLPNIGSNYARYTIISVSGTVALKGLLTGPKTTLDLASLKRGVYLLKIGSAGTSHTFKVVKK